ncbi:MAG: hypothetical protein AB3N24_23690 [Leisingera sp.]
MAWVSAAVGALGGLALAIAVGVFGGWPLWLILLLYPVTAVLLMLIVLAVLFWRSSRPGYAGKHSNGSHSAASGAPRTLGPGLF